ncbi:hypothetical protein SGCZBJ_15110 [Caulobacter zeae]|uniref:Uncharacterized protein n=1 Tax=Caulobacter zeae TaxID=2055137 RepID=A0A2N5DCW6_9CAUL|nr:hypothetical protein SGCZBJ_15110 [Caulobacter zeae]
MGLRCLRLLEAVVWPVLAVVLPDWRDLATPLSLLFVSAVISAPVARPLIDGIPRFITGSTTLVLGMGLVWTYLAPDLIDGAWNRGFIVLALLVACRKARVFDLERRPRWALIVAAGAACLALFALDHQRILAANAELISRYADSQASASARGNAEWEAMMAAEIAHLRAADRSWWVLPTVLAVLPPVGRFVARRGLAFIRRRDVGRSRKAWFRHPANLSSD